MLSAKLLARRLSLKIVGRANGYVRDEEMPGLVREINESKAQGLFLALAASKQGKWFSTYGSALNQKVLPVFAWQVFMGKIRGNGIQR